MRYPPGMRYLIPVDPSGDVGPHFGKAQTVAIAQVADGELSGWDEVVVGWGDLHDSGTHGSHHARIVGFLREHRIEAVVARGAGEPMQRTLRAMGVQLVLGAQGPARAAILAADSALQHG